MLPPSYTCPSCKCHALYRTRRKGFGWLMSLVGFWPARCFTCRRKCYVYLRRPPVSRRPQNPLQPKPQPKDVPETPIPKRLKLHLD
jgi:hypothetical protein